MYTLVSNNGSKYLEILELDDPAYIGWKKSIPEMGGIVEDSFDKICELELKYNTNELGFIIGYESYGRCWDTLHEWSFFVPTEIL